MLTARKRVLIEFLRCRSLRERWIALSRERMSEKVKELFSSPSSSQVLSKKVSSFCIIRLKSNYQRSWIQLYNSVLKIKDRKTTCDYAHKRTKRQIHSVVALFFIRISSFLFFLSFVHIGHSRNLVYGPRLPLIRCKIRFWRYSLATCM